MICHKCPARAHRSLLLITLVVMVALLATCAPKRDATPIASLATERERSGAISRPGDVIRSDAPTSPSSPKVERMVTPPPEGPGSESSVPTEGKASGTQPDASAMLTCVPDNDLQERIDRAVAYLRDQYNPEVGLLSESPVVAPNTYWLATDNQLAVYALERAGETALASAIADTLKRYQRRRHGLIEVLAGEGATWPPHVPTHAVVARGDGWEIKEETRVVGLTYPDWDAYADLVLYAALNELHDGFINEARRWYDVALDRFDDIGFADKAYEADGLYATYKLALAAYVGCLLDGRVDAGLWDELLAKQAPSGGFYTLYDVVGVPQGDTNTETTAYALLALLAMQGQMPIMAPSMPEEIPEPIIREAIQRGIEFLKRQYNPSIGLLQESPRIGRHNYYLNDSALAAYVLEVLGEEELAAALRATLERYGYEGNDFFELAWGEPITWPPYHHKDEKMFDDEDISREGEGQILLQRHPPSEGFFFDWMTYSNLAFMEAMNAHVKGDYRLAWAIYRTKAAEFDGNGWPDQPYIKRGGVYETLGVAWALYSGVIIDYPEIDRLGPKLIRILLEEQGELGGFHTHYRADAPRLADPNIETTSVALPGLHAWLERN